MNAEELELLELYNALSDEELADLDDEEFAEFERLSKMPQNLNPEHKEFDKPLREMSPEARAWTIAQREGVPYDEVLNRFRIRPTSAMEEAETGESNWSKRISDAITYPQRGALELMSYAPSGIMDLITGKESRPYQMQDLPQDQGSFGGKITSGLASDPSTAISGLGGKFAQLMSKGASPLAKGVALTLGEGSGDVAGKMMAGEEMTPSNVASSYGFGALSGMSAPTADVAKGFIKDLGRSKTSIPNSTIDFASKKGAWNKLKTALDDSKDLPAELIQAIKKGFPEEANRRKDEILAEMPEMDFQPVMELLIDKLPELRVITDKKATKVLEEQLNMWVDRYDKTDYKVSPQEFYKLRTELDNALEWGKIDDTMLEKYDKVFKAVANKMRGDLVENAPTKEYKEVMKELADGLDATSKAKKMFVLDDWRTSKAQSALDNIEGKAKVDHLKVLKEFDNFYNTDFYETASKSQMAQQIGMGEGFMGMPSVANQRRSGRTPLEFLTTLTGSSPAFSTGITYPALDALKGFSESAIGRQGAQQISEESMMQLMGLQGANPYE